MKIIYTAFLFLIFTGIQVHAQCGVTDTIIDIPDNEQPLEIQIIVDGVTNNDLSDPNQGVCGVTLWYDHVSRHNLTIDLISPSGQKVRLVGPYSNINQLTGNLEWDISFVPSAYSASPHSGADAIFNNNNDTWRFGNSFGGSYYPNSGNLEDFNTGSVNGTWTFVVHDHYEIYKGHLYGYTIEFCDGSSTDCRMCDADAGYFENTEYYFCKDDPDISIAITSLYEGEQPDTIKYGNNYFIYQNNTLIDISDSPDFNNYSSGVYKICGLSYYKGDSTDIFNLLNSLTPPKFIDSLELIGSPYCADVTDTCITLVIKDVDVKLNIDTSICNGDTLYFHGEKLYETGTYYISPNNNFCDTAYNLNLKVWDLQADIVAEDDTIRCPDAVIVLDGLGYIQNVGMEYTWIHNQSFFGSNTLSPLISSGGTYKFILSVDNCSDTASVDIQMDVDVPLLEFDIQDINCDNDTALLVANSPNANLDSVIWFDGYSHRYMGKQVKVTNSGVYNVYAVSEEGCKVLSSIEVKEDTIIPQANLNSTIITCNNDTAFINFESNDSLRSIYWTELGTFEEDPIVFTPGTYHVEFIGKNGCVSYDSIVVIENTKVPSYTISADTLNCEKLTGKIDIQTTENNLVYKWITPNNDTLLTQDIDITNPGTYKYTITNDINGCEVTENIEIIQDVSPPDLLFTSDTFFISCGQDSVQLHYNSGDSIIETVWRGPLDFVSNDRAPFVKYFGTYTVTIEGKNHCLNSGTIEVVGDSTVPEIEILTDTINCIDRKANLRVLYDATNNYSFNWIDPFYNAHTGNSIIVAEGSGRYILTVTDNDNNCSNIFVAEVPRDDIPPDVEIIASNELDCTHDNATLSLENNTDLKTIHWLGNGINTMANQVVINNEGTYTVEVTANNFCTDTDTIEISEKESLILEPDTFYLTCMNNKEVELQLLGISDTNTFTWTGPGFNSNDSSPIVSNEGKYKVIVQNGDCIDSTEILVEYDTLAPDVGITYDPVIECDPNYSILTAIINSSDIDTYNWNFPNNISSSKLIDTAYVAGQYSFFARGNNGCVSSYIFNISISQDYADVTAIGDTVNCITGFHDLTISADIIGDYKTLTWDGPNGYSSTQNMNVVSQAGEYQITVITEENCVTTTSAFVSIDTITPKLLIPPVDTITCYKDTILLEINSVMPNLKYNWKGPFGFKSTSKNINVGVGGDYVVEVTADNGCKTIDTIIAPINKLKPYIILKSDNLDGNHSKVTIDLSTSADIFSNNWSGPNNFSSTAEDIEINESGTYIVSLIDLNNGCEATDSITIIWDTIPPNIYSNDYFLNCDTNKIKLIATSNIVGTKFTWTGPNGFYVEGAIVYTNIAGDYTIFAIGPNGIVNSKTITVFDIPIYPEFEAYGNTLNCYSDSTVIRAIGVNDDKFFEWRGANGFYSTEREPYVHSPGEYSLIVTGKNNCIDTIIVTVDADTITPILQIESIDPFICEKNTGQLNVSILNILDYSYSYYWSTDEGTLTQGQYTDNPLIEGKGTYYIEVKNIDNGCGARDSILVLGSIYNLDSASILLTSPRCFGYSDGKFIVDSVYGGAPPYKYSLDNYWFSNVKSFNSKNAGEYKLYIKDAYGCRLDTSIIIDEGADVQLQLGVDKNNIFLGDTVNLEAIVQTDAGIRDYLWEPSEYFKETDTTLTSFSPPKSMEVSLTVVDTNGCSDISTVWIKVKGKPDIYVPNIFSPNHDDINDYFFIKSGSGVKNINEFIIYDRWGGVVFNKKDLRQNVPIDGWNGQCNGKDVIPGVYVYLITLELTNGEIERITGDITLIK